MLPIRGNVVENFTAASPPEAIHEEDSSPYELLDTDGGNSDVDIDSGGWTGPMGGEIISSCRSASASQTALLGASAVSGDNLNGSSGLLPEIVSCSDEFLDNARIDRPPSREIARISPRKIFTSGHLLPTGDRQADCGTCWAP